MKRQLKLVVCAAAVALCAGAYAKDSDDGDKVQPWLPIGLSIISPPVQLPSSSHTVFGAMLNLGYGQMTDVAIFDLGIVNNVTRNMLGLEVGPVNIVGTCFGAQVGAINFADSICGVQLGVINYTGELHGVQIGVLNFSSNGGATVFPIFNVGF